MWINSRRNLTAQARREKIQDLIGRLHVIDKEVEIEEKSIRSLASANAKLRESSSRLNHFKAKSRELSSVTQASALPPMEGVLSLSAEVKTHPLH